MTKHDELTSLLGKPGRVVAEAARLAFPILPDAIQDSPQLSIFNLPWVSTHTIAA
jgi:hypothetical protein